MGTFFLFSLNSCMFTLLEWMNLFCGKFIVNVFIVSDPSLYKMSMIWKTCLLSQSWIVQWVLISCIDFSHCITVAFCFLTHGDFCAKWRAILHLSYLSNASQKCCPFGQHPLNYTEIMKLLTSFITHLFNAFNYVHNRLIFYIYNKLHVQCKQQLLKWHMKIRAVQETRHWISFTCH